MAENGSSFHSKFKLHTSIIFILLFFLSIILIFSLSSQYQYTSSPYDSFQSIGNSQFGIHSNFDSGDVITVSFHNIHSNEISFSVKLNTYVLFSTSTPNLSNQSISLPYTGEYVLVFTNPYNQTTIFFSIILNRAGHSTDISRNFVVPKGDSFIVNELLQIFFLFILLTMFPLIVLLSLGKFSFSSKHLNFDPQDLLFIWKSPYKEKALIFFSIIPIILVIFFDILINVNSKSVGFIGIIFLFTICNCIASIKFITLLYDSSSKNILYLYNGAITIVSFLLYLLYIQFDFFSSSLKVIVNTLGLSGLNVNYNGGTNTIFFPFLAILPVLIILVLLGIYQLVFSNKNYFNLNESKIISFLKIIFIPIVFSKEIQLTDLVKGEIEKSITEPVFSIKKFYTVSLYSNNFDQPFQLISGSQLEVFKILYLLLSSITIPIQYTSGKNIFKIYQDRYVTKDVILDTYPLKSLIKDNK